LASTATVALGHHGQVTGFADCTGWNAQATIYDTTSDRLVEVTTNVPTVTTLNSTGFSAGSGGLQVWSKTGTSPINITITLSIYKPNGDLENQSSLAIQSPSDCETETPSPSPSPTPEPSIPDTSIGG
jgi:hypothetical protein